MRTFIWREGPEDAWLVVTADSRQMALEFLAVVLARGWKPLEYDEYVEEMPVRAVYDGRWGGEMRDFSCMSPGLSGRVDPGSETAGTPGEG